MSKKDSLVITEERDKVVKFTLNRPEKKNALSAQLVEDLLSAFEEYRKREEIRVIITTGVGDSFSGGMDVNWLRDLMMKDGGQAARVTVDPHPIVVDLYETIRKYPKPVIAAVNGYCLGAAISFLLSFDIIISSDKAKFGLPEVMRGFTPRLVIGVLVKSIPIKYALDLTLTGLNWDAEKAERAGLVTRVVPHDKLEETAFEIANFMAQWDPVTMDYCKQAAYQSLDQPTYAQAIEMSSLMHERCNVVNPKPLEGLLEFIQGQGVKASRMEK